MQNFASIDDIIELWRPLTNEEITRATALLPVISDTLRIEADKAGVDLDQKSNDNMAYANVLKSVTVDVLARTLMTPTDKEPMTQESQSALGYSWSGTFLSPGGGLFIKKDELKRLGLKRQKIGGRHLYGEDTWNTGYFDYQRDYWL